MQNPADDEATLERKQRRNRILWGLGIAVLVLLGVLHLTGLVPSHR